jgi:hypothetical protein
MAGAVLDAPGLGSFLSVREVEGPPWRG